MRLYIMSRGRVHKQTTLANLPRSLRDRIVLVVPARERAAYAAAHGDRANVLDAPPSVTNYSQKFQWILDGLPVDNVPLDKENKAVILDDDLVFSKRDGASLKTVRDPEELLYLFDQMDEMLSEYALVGVHPRQMGQNAKTPFILNGRIICIQGINRRLIGNVKVDPIPILADVILNCTLLSRGNPNALITTFFQDHGPCQAAGGCSDYRTPAMQKACAEYIAARWSPFARTVIRRPKVAKWMGGERTEFTVQWKRLYEYGLENPGACGSSQIAIPVLDQGEIAHTES